MRGFLTRSLISFRESTLRPLAECDLAIGTARAFSEGVEMVLPQNPATSGGGGQPPECFASPPGGNALPDPSNGSPSPASRQAPPAWRLAAFPADERRET